MNGYVSPLDRVSQGLGQAAQVEKGARQYIHGQQEAHPLVAQAIRRIYGGEDPRTVAIETKFAMSRQQPMPNMPEPAGAPTQAPGAPTLQGSMRSSMPQLQGSMQSVMPPQLRGRVEDVTGMEPGEAVGMRGYASTTPPAEAVGMRGSMRAGPMRAEPPVPSSEDLGLAPLEETITAPRQPPPQQRGSMPLMSEPSTSQAFYSQAQAPILNRDLPVLMQGAGLVNKEDKNDLGMLNYLLGRDRLGNAQRVHGDMEVHRGIRDTATKANVAEIPVRRGQAERRLGISAFNAQTGRGNLDTTRTRLFLEGTKETAQAIPQLRSIIANMRNAPGVAPPDWDYATRKMGKIMGGMPFVGDALKEGFETVADTALTPEQYQIRSRIAQAVQPYRKLAVGTQITPGEFALVDLITGQGLHPRDQIAALMSLERSMTARQGRVEAGYPEMPGRIPMASPDQVMPQIRNPYPTGAGGDLQPLPGEADTLGQFHDLLLGTGR